MAASLYGDARLIPVLLMVRELGPGGTERQLTEIARHLDRSRFEVHVGCFRPGIRNEDLEAAGIPVETIRVTSLANPSVFGGAWQLIGYLKRHRIRILHTFDAPLNLFAVPVGKLGLAKIISSQRGHRSLAPKVRRLLRFTDRIADAIVVNCEYLRDHLTSDEGVTPEKIRLCYNGLDTSVFYPDRKQGEPFTIGITCVLRREKGLPTLIKAFAKVRCLSSPRSLMRLCIVGSGAMLEELQALAASLGIGQDVVFQPSTGDVRPWLNRMDVFVLPSLDEALSNSVMEAMACGCAVIASRVGGNPELVHHGETGLLFEKENVEDLAAQLQKLIEEPALLQRIATAGAQHIAREFSVEASARRMGEIYTEILG